MQESSVGPGMQLSGSDQHGMLNSLKADHRSNITQLCCMFHGFPWSCCLSVMSHSSLIAVLVQAEAGGAWLRTISQLHESNGR